MLKTERALSYQSITLEYQYSTYDNIASNTYKHIIFTYKIENRYRIDKYVFMYISQTIP